jgi:hypothetical protein
VAIKSNAGQPSRETQMITSTLQSKKNKHYFFVTQTQRNSRQKKKPRNKTHKQVSVQTLSKLHANHNFQSKHLIIQYMENKMLKKCVSTSTLFQRLLVPMWVHPDQFPKTNHKPTHHQTFVFCATENFKGTTFIEISTEFETRLSNTTQKGEREPFFDKTFGKREKIVVKTHNLSEKKKKSFHTCSWNEKEVATRQIQRKNNLLQTKHQW